MTSLHTLRNSAPKAYPPLEEITTCRLCPRLVEWRETVANEKVARFKEWEYWGKPVPSFGNTNARLLIVGLAPAAHGANRTGRMFTGDRSGEWLYRTLHKFGFANQPESISRDDGLQLIDCYITATLHCAPPQNKPLPEETRNCRPFFLQELEALKNVLVIIALGKIAHDAVYDSFISLKKTTLTKRPPFKHNGNVLLNERITLLASYHPSQQNTFTGKLTQKMFDAVFQRAKTLLSAR
ncbi:MAG: uracil-DNA glycosylase [Bacteroidetes bacterium]|nr:MAG: uracil-DNA glycosylase [Bacteroidota bacterium]